MTKEPAPINNIIRSRRSIFPRDFTGARVEDQVVRQMLENANWAPSHKLTEPWRFIVYTGEGLRRLAELQAACYESRTRADGTFSEDKYIKLLKKPLESSHIIVVAMKRDPHKRLPEVEELGAVFCAIQNMHLTATAYGIGGYLSTGGITYFEEAKQLFGLDQEDRLIGFFHIGTPAQWPDGHRGPFESKFKWIDK
ncbi:MAG: nitroreductase [Cyclobacteriaceae bacterium]|nr:nitroreductase [Cyclobacteriaceae bacterium]